MAEAGGGPVEERYRIDDLARLAGTTVRNVRAYQDRALLPPPDKIGRVGWYSEAHLARLRLIGEMLSRGYTLANIAELIDVWVRGQDLRDVLGLEAALIAPWGEDRSHVYTEEELRELLAPLGSEHLGAAIQLGLITSEGDRFRVGDRRLIEGASVLLRAGVPVEAVFELGATIATATDNIARLYVEMVSKHIVGDLSDPLSPQEVRNLSEVVRRLRPLAKEVVDAGLATALDRRIGSEVGSHLARAGSPEEPPASRPVGFGECDVKRSEAVTGSS
jgi:DNA-binding transcriptional MerR regulator